MSGRTAFPWMALLVSMCLAYAAIVAILAQDIYPRWAGPILLVGVLPVGLGGWVLARMLIGSRRAESRARFRSFERPFAWLIVAESLAFFIPAEEGFWGYLRLAILGVIGCGMGWLALRATPPRPPDNDYQI